MSSRRRRKKNQDIKGKLILAVGLVVIAALGYTVFEIKKGIVKRDGDNLCRVDNVISRETAIIIDATDNYSESQALFIKKEIQKILLESTIDERFTLYVLGEDHAKSSGYLSICNPGDGSDKSELTSNKRRLLHKWKDSFYQKLVNEVDELIGQHVAKHSPILEMLKLVSIKSMYNSPALKKRIILISDMLHHTPEYSHYNEIIDYKKYSTSAYAISMKPKLSEVEVNILYLFRAKDVKLQNRGHISFWEALVSDSDGIITNVKSVN